MPKNEPGTIYLLCFPTGLESRPGVFARHYMGWTGNGLDERLAEHLSGHGARIVRAAVARGLTPVLVRTWAGVTRTEERRMKRWKNLPRLCPVCRSRLTEGSVGTDHCVVATHDTPNEERSMTTMNTHTDLQDAADHINAAHAAKCKITVNGREVKTWHAPATIWGTGSMSVNVKARTTGGINQVWFKPGHIVNIEVTR